VKKLQPLHFERHKTAKASCFEYDGMIETSLMTEQPAVVNCDVAKMLKKTIVLETIRKPPLVTA